MRARAEGRWREVLAAGGALAERGFQGRGAAQAVGDAGEDDREIGGAERLGEDGEARGGGALAGRGGELPAVVDQSADDAEDAAEGAGDGCGVPLRIGGRGRGGGLGFGRHERNKNTKNRALSRKSFLRSRSQNPREARSRCNEDLVQRAGGEGMAHLGVTK